MLEEDTYNVSIVPLFCAVLNELKKVGELYYLAHKLVSANVDSAVAWFSVVSSCAFVYSDYSTYLIFRAPTIS